MRIGIRRDDVIGLARPGIDAHTLGITAAEQVLADCGYSCVVADAAVCEAFAAPEAGIDLIERWVRRHRVTVLGFSYRLDPADGAAAFARLVRQLERRKLLAEAGGPIRGLYFAGLPRACELVRARCPQVSATFCGDESIAETLDAFGIDPAVLPSEFAAGVGYDEARLAFGQDLIAKGDYLSLRPVDRSGYPEFGTRKDTLVARLAHSRRNNLPPLMRAHVGPYRPQREQAVAEFIDWTGRLARSGMLDVLSIGTSQLTQSDFGSDWGDRPNGGGVPINSPAEFEAVWQAARPMLVRTYAGTRNIPALAEMHERTINIAWHALSLWWFCRIDGRGPHSVHENLHDHVETLKYIATTGKPFEPNVSHHFSFRGADDVTYVVAAYLSARLAKSLGVSRLVLQNMLNTPKQTWGTADLAKSRAMLALVRSLADENFEVILQPRGGLDYFSPDLDKARAQLAAVTALMDDIEPHDPHSPQVIHVVSYSEASHLADPAVVDESVRITLHALAEYRRLRSAGLVDDMAKHPEVAGRTAELVNDARAVLAAVEAAIPEPYTAAGLYAAFAAGFLPVPNLWECRGEFARAVDWQTRLVRGGVKIVDPAGRPIGVEERIRKINSSGIAGGPFPDP